MYLTVAAITPWRAACHIIGRDVIAREALDAMQFAGFMAIAIFAILQKVL